MKLQRDRVCVYGLRCTVLSYSHVLFLGKPNSSTRKHYAAHLFERFLSLHHFLISNLIIRFLII